MSYRFTASAARWSARWRQPHFGAKRTSAAAWSAAGAAAATAVEVAGTRAMEAEIPSTTTADAIDDCKMTIADTMQ